MTSIANFLNRVIYGDCLRVMPTMPSESVDLVVTDPPYLVNFRTRDGKSAYPNDTHSRWLKPAFAEIYRLLKPGCFCVCFYGWMQAERFIHAWKNAGFFPVSHLVWIKPYCSRAKFTRAHHDVAYLLAKGKPEPPAHPPRDVFRWEYAGNTLHPAQRPVMVMTPLIRAFSKEGDVVFDPFAGSGSTAVAARQCRREFIVIEKVWRYYKIAHDRLNYGDKEEQVSPHNLPLSS